MKRIILIIIATAIIFPTIAQEDSIRVRTLEESGEQTSNTGAISSDDGMVAYQEPEDIRKIRIGNRGYEILEILEGDRTRLTVRRYDTEGEMKDASGFFHDNDKPRKRVPGRRRFEGHWSGIEIGFNNYLTPDKSMILPIDEDFMTLNSGRSKSVNLNFAQINLGITRRIGVVTGLGFHMNNYFFEGNNNITKLAGGVIEPFIPEGGIKYDKSKLSTRYITLPLLLEIQIPANYNKTLNIAGGGIGAVKVGSHTKTVYYSDGKQKVKDHGDFSLNMLRYGVTARVGYEMIQLYGTYYMTPLFKSGKGPELYPFEIGVSFTFND